LAESIGQQHHLVGKWPMADHYFVLWAYVFSFGRPDSFG